MGFVANLLLFPAVKNFENLLRIDKVIAMSLVYYTGHSVLTLWWIDRLKWTFGCFKLSYVWQPFYVIAYDASSSFQATAGLLLLNNNKNNINNTICTAQYCVWQCDGQSCPWRILIAQVGRFLRRHDWQN